MAVRWDRALQQRIEEQAGRLLREDNPDFPVEAPGAVRTLLYPCGVYGLLPEQMRVLRDLEVARGSRGFVGKLFIGEWTYHVKPDGPFPLGRPTATRTLGADLEGNWDQLGFDRVPSDRWFEGDWMPNASDRVDLGDGALVENMLMDDAGTWALLFSQDDYAYLVSDCATTTLLLDAWRTSPEREVAAFEADMIAYEEMLAANFGGADGATREHHARMLSHARSALIDRGEN